MPRRLRVGAQRVLLVAFLVSAIAHLFGAALFNAFVRPHVLLAGDPERVVVSTTTLTFERRESQRSPNARPKTHEPLPQPAAAAASRPAPPHAAAAPSRRRELAKIVAYAPPAPKAARVPAENEAARLAADQARFSRTLAHLRAANDPIASQQLNAAGSGNAKRYGADFSSVPDTVHGGEGYLAPVKSWKDGPYVYYYLRYDVVYPDGSRESGYVPWPVRYLAKDDPFVHSAPPYRMPLPVPMPDFVPSSDDDMKPLVAFCYRHRAEVPSCPIMHE